MKRYFPNNYVNYDEESGRSRIARVLQRYDDSLAYWSPIFQEARDDDAFIGGKQWPDHVVRARKDEGRPILTYNLFPSFCRIIVNKVRQDRPQIKAQPVQSDKASKIPNLRGSQDYSMSDVYSGIIKHIEYVSDAGHAYDTAITHAVHHGFGFFTAAAIECQHDPFVQELRIERVRDPYSVLMDPQAQKVDFSDMADAFIVERVSKDAFAANYPDAHGGEFGHMGSVVDGGWADRDTVQIATYWWIEHRKDEVIKMTDGRVHYLSDVEDVLDELADKDAVYIARDAKGKELRKDVRRPIARWQKMTNTEFLSEEEDSVFDQIPVFPVLGDEQIVNGRMTYESAIRHAKDAQRSYNYHRTAAVETTALAPKAPYVLTTRQVKGQEREWAQANKTGKPFLAYNSSEGDPPPQRQMPPPVSAAELSLSQQDGADVQTIIGLHEASLGAESNERTGKAVLARQAQGATSTFNFPANLNRAIRRCGRVVARAIPKIYDTERVMRLRFPDDSEDDVVINRVVLDEETGEERVTHDIAFSHYDVVIDTGPSYQTQRQESVEAMLELIRVMPPEVLLPFSRLLVQSMSFPGADKIAAMLRKMVPDNLKSPQEREEDLPPGLALNDQGEVIVKATGEPYTPPPTPEQTLATEEARAEQAKHAATKAKASADTQMAEAKAMEAQAKIAEAQRPPGDPADVGPPGVQIEELRAALAEAMQQHEGNPEAHRDAVQSAVVDAMVELLPKLKGVIDQTTAAQGQRLEQQISQSVAQRALPAQASAKDAPAPPAKVLRIDFKTDDQGRIVSGVPAYAKNDKGEKSAGIDFEYEDGAIAAARLKGSNG